MVSAGEPLQHEPRAEHSRGHPQTYRGADCAGPGGATTSAQGRLNLAEYEQPRVVATFDTYAGMLEAIRARVNELQVNGERLDEYVGLPRGYYFKVAGAKPIRRLGMTSFAPILNGLGLKCQFVENQEATERLKSRVPPRKSSFVRCAPSIVLTVRYFKRIGRKGAQARVDNSTKEQRQEWAKKAATARWQKATS